MPYRWLIFDADNTLFDFDRAQTEALEKTFANLGYAFGAEHHTLYNRINAELWKRLERGEIPQAAIKKARFKRLGAETGWAFDVAGVSSSYLRHLSEGSYLLDGTLDLVKRLSETHRLIIMTNGLKEVQRPRFAASPVAGYMQDILISDELGVAKPDHGIFDIAFERMGLPAHAEVLMIGDSLSSDIAGGANYGIDTCWFNPRNKANNGGVKPTYIVKTLNEVSLIARPKVYDSHSP